MHYVTNENENAHLSSSDFMNIILSKADKDWMKKINSYFIGMKCEWAKIAQFVFSCGIWIKYSPFDALEINYLSITCRREYIHKRI